MCDQCLTIKAVIKIAIEKIIPRNNNGRCSKLSHVLDVTPYSCVPFSKWVSHQLQLQFTCRFYIKSRKIEFEILSPCDV